MRFFYENLEEDDFYQLIYDETDGELITYTGHIHTFHTNKTECKKTEKIYKNPATGKKNVEKRCATLESKGYVLSDPDFHLELKTNITKAKKEKLSDLIVYVYSNKCWEAIAELDHLIRLDISVNGNDLSIPKEFGNLTSLTTLNISGNPIALPDVFDKLSNLQHFNLYCNQDSKYSQLPDSFYQCTSLNTLDLSNSEIQFLSGDIGNLIELEELNINQTKITQLPGGIGNCKKLHRIYAMHCPNLTSLPDEIGELESLEYLLMSYSKIQSLPDPISKLNNLVTLDLSNGEISVLPEDIGNMESLSILKLDLDYHTAQTGIPKIKTIPDSIGQLKNLKELNLNNHAVTELPPSFGNLANLEYLYLDYNKITTFDEGFFKLSKLDELHLRGNGITELSKSFKKLENLDELELADNEIPNIPQDVLGWGNADDILGYLEDDEPKTELENTLSKEEQRLVLEQYAEPITKYLRFTKEEYGKEQEDMYAVHKFFTFETDVVPTLKKKKWYSSDEGQQVLWILFAPFQNWTEVDHRIMMVLSKNTWGEPSKFKKDYDRDHGLNWCFFKWYQTQIENGQEPDYEDIVDLLKKYENGDKVFEDCLGHLASHLHKDGQPTKFGEVVIAKFKEDADGLLKLLTCMNESRVYTIKDKIVDLLIQFAFEDNESLIQQYLFASYTDSKGNADYNVNTDNVRLFVSQNPEKYEAILLEAADKIRYVSRQPQCGIDLHRFYGMKHKDLIVKLVSKNLGSVLVYGKKWFQLKLDGENVCSPATYVDWLIAHFKDGLKEPLLKVLEERKETEVFYKALIDAYPKDILPIMAALLAKEENVGMILPLLNKHDYSAFHEVLWFLVSSDEISNRKLAAAELVRLYPENHLIEKSKAFLKEKKANFRDGAVQVLLLIKEGKNKSILKNHLSKEKDKSIRETIVKFVKESGDTDFLSKEIFAEFEDLKKKEKLKKPIKAWLDETKLPSAYWKDGKAVDPLMMRFLFQKQKAKETDWYQPSEEVALVLDMMGKEKSADFAHELLQLILKNGEIKAANKLFLPMVAYLGDNRVVEAMKNYCTKKNNVLSANLLSNNTSLYAARALDAIMLHFKVKYPNVREAASESFGKIANEMGVSSLELQDKMIPDFGFENLFKTLEVDGKEYRVFINADLKLAYLDELDNIKKSLPSKASKELKEEIKILNKEIRTIAKQQKLSLEHNFICERKWEVADWQKHFMTKPLMFALAQSLIWGIYEKGMLKSIFGLNEDQTLEDAKLEEITLPKNTQIGMVHPIELDQEQLTVWQDYIKENKLNQPFDQMSRPIYLPDEVHRFKTILFNFEGKTAKAGSFKSVMEKRGWRRGSVQDGGGVYAYRKAFEVSGIEVFIALEGMGVQIWDYSEPVTLKELFFTKINSIEVGSYVYDTYKGEDDERLFLIKDLPLVVYSETINDLNLLIER